MSGSSAVKPTNLRKEGDNHLIIEWSDGEIYRYSWQELRDACPCASCKEEHTHEPDPLRILSPAELQPLKPTKISPVGYYAYKITWSDGHDTGLFTLDYLRQLGTRDS